MLDGWYCRSIANMQANEASVSNNAPPEPPQARDSHKEYSSDSSSDPEPEPNYRAQYMALKKKLKYLIYVSSQRVLPICLDQSVICQNADADLSKAIVMPSREVKKTQQANDY